MHLDRIECLHERLVQLKSECLDTQFQQYLEQVELEANRLNQNTSKLLESLDYNYAIYCEKHKLDKAPIEQEAPLVKKVVPEIPKVASETPKVVPKSAQPSRLEFQFGVFISTIIGICFLLSAFVTLGMNYMGNLLQGLFLYVIAGAIIAASELFLGKKNRVFGNSITSLGISCLFVATVLNYLYIESCSVWVAAGLVLLTSALAMFISKLKNSRLIRVICLLGCYICLLPFGTLDKIQQFIIPAIMILAISVTSIIYPLRGKQLGIQIFQLVCIAILTIHFCSLFYMSGIFTWPLYIFIALLSIISYFQYFRMDRSFENKALLIIAQVFFTIVLLFVGYEEPYLAWAILGMSIVLLGMVFLFIRDKLRFLPLYILISYAILALCMQHNLLLLSIAIIIAFIVVKFMTYFFEEIRVFDLVATIFTVLFILFGTRNNSATIVGYIAVAVIGLSLIFVKKWKGFYNYFVITFLVLFLLSEQSIPILFSVILAALALTTIALGFVTHDKGIRIYGLVMMSIDAVKLAFFDFANKESGVRIIVFCIIGILVLAISYLYIVMEKKYLEIETDNSL